MTVARERKVTAARPGPATPPRPGLSRLAPINASEALADSRMRSRGVGTLKVALAVAAVAIAGLVLAWPSLAPDDRRVRLGGGQKLSAADADTLRMVNARYVGLDDQNRPYVLTANRAIEGAGDGMVYLDRPRAELSGAEGAATSVTSEKGELERETKRLLLTSKVLLTHSTGLEIRSELAHVDLTTHDSWGDQPVAGVDPSKRFDGQGFRTTNGGMRIFLTGKSHVTLLATPEGLVPKSKPAGDNPSADPAPAVTP